LIAFSFASFLALATATAPRRWERCGQGGGAGEEGGGGGGCSTFHNLPFLTDPLPAFVTHQYCVSVIIMQTTVFCTLRRGESSKTKSEKNFSGFFKTRLMSKHEVALHP
jgi:hypothetical protein